MNRTCTTACLALLAVGLPAVPASAGGILPIASPAFGNSCGNHGTGRTSAATTHGTGTASGNVSGLPISGPGNHCGGADLQPLLTERGFLTQL